jgi:hypothetical protein
MYLLNWSEKSGLVEASLGGRITPQEIEALGEEVSAILSEAKHTCHVLLDYGMAQQFESPVYLTLGEVKDRWLDEGVACITSVPQGDAEIAAETTMRLQEVLEGREQFIRDVANFQKERREHRTKRAA